jgi:threonine dehydratase
MRSLGAELVEHGEDFQAALEYAQHLEQENGWHWVPSFHRQLVTGVSTYALEFLSAVSELDTVYVPIGMGSGVCGIIAVRDALGLKTSVVGVTSKHAPATALSLANGGVVEHAVSTRIADGVSCRKPDESALEVMRTGLERIVEVDDDEVEEAMRIYFADTHNVVEGAGAVGLAGLLKEVPKGGQCVGTVVTGGNVDSEVFAAVLQRRPR